MSQILDESWRKYRNQPAEAPGRLVVEASFLQRFFTSDCIRTHYDDIGQIHVYLSTNQHAGAYDCHRFIITGDDTVNGPTGETLYFYYFGSHSFRMGDNYGLIIQDQDENILYWREANQDPRTEWLINCLAYDLEDENGDFIFDGEPTTV